jgi:hypothetical protein
VSGLSSMTSFCLRIFLKLLRVWTHKISKYLRWVSDGPLLSPYFALATTAITSYRSSSVLFFPCPRSI